MERLPLTSTIRENRGRPESQNSFQYPPTSCLQGETYLHGCTQDQRPSPYPFICFYYPFRFTFRVFDGALATRFDSNLNHGTLLKEKSFRCRNNNDIVPRIVPLPYTHVGTEIYLDRL